MAAMRMRSGIAGVGVGLGEGEGAGLGARAVADLVGVELRGVGTSVDVGGTADRRESTYG